MTADDLSIGWVVCVGDDVLVRIRRQDDGTRSVRVVHEGSLVFAQYGMSYGDAMVTAMAIVDYILPRAEGIRLEME